MLDYCCPTEISLPPIENKFDAEATFNMDDFRILAWLEAAQAGAQLLEKNAESVKSKRLSEGYSLALMESVETPTRPRRFRFRLL